MPVQRCPRCGTPRRGDLQVCVRCEAPFDSEDSDLDLALPRPAAPATTQSHGTLAIALLSSFVVLAVVLYFSVRGVGPFAGTIATQRVVNGKATVTVTVENRGSRAGRANCEIAVVAVNGGNRAGHRFSSPRVKGHATVSAPVTFDIDADERISGKVTC